MNREYDHAVTAIDTGFYRENYDASYLIVENGRAAFVDTGTNHSIPHLIAALKQKGLGPERVDFVILTHVHLDHAGGAGLAMREFPNARLIVHPRGARHMIDPTALVAGATAVYGAEEIRRGYGTLLPVPAGRVIEAPDGYLADLAGRPLQCFDTPGHARHHIAIHDARSDAFFTGDTFGIAYVELDTPNGRYVFPTSSPSQFEPEALKASIARLLEREPRWMFPTHYGRIGDVARCARDLIEQIDAMAAIATAHGDAGDRHARIMADLAPLYVSRALALGCPLSPERIGEVVAIDVELNAQGLELWLDRHKT